MMPEHQLSGLAEQPLGRLSTLRLLRPQTSSLNTGLFLSNGLRMQPAFLSCLKLPSVTLAIEVSSILSQLQSVGGCHSYHTLPSPEQTTVHFLYHQETDKS